MKKILITATLILTASCYITAQVVFNPPQNVTAELISDNDVKVDWLAPAGTPGELTELIQHDGNPENGYYQEYDNGYGVVYDISAYPDCTIEYLDFRHSSWGTFGTWDYKLHIVDWDTYNEVAVIGPLQTTGDDQWELGIPLGSIAGQSGLVGVFLEPMSNDPADAYPCLDSDNVGPDGMSYNGVLGDYSTFTLSTIGDFLMDLWVMTASIDQLINAPLKYSDNNTNEELLGYNVYKNDEFMELIEVPLTEYYEYDLIPATYEYCISAVYDEGESEWACAEPIVGPVNPPGPTNLTGPEEVTIGNMIHLTWDYQWENQWIRWDNGVNTGNGVGLANGGTFYAASHWYPEDLLPFHGLQLMEIEFFANADPDASYTIKIWTGADGTNEVHSQEVTVYNVDDWNNVVLSTPVSMDASLDLWFGYEVTHEASTFPAGCDDGPAVAYKGDMIYASGEWVSMSIDYGMDYNWNIAGFVGLADVADTKSSLEVLQLPDSESDLIACGSNGAYHKPSPNKNGKDFLYYNIYREGPGSSSSEIIGTSTLTEYFDDSGLMGNNNGMYQYYVTAFWEPQGESYPSNIHWVAVLYTGIDDHLSSIVSLYPNPTSDNVTIESEFEIISLKVYNPTGQTIAEEVVNNNIYKLDVSQLNAGIYFLQVEFEEESILKKIVVE